MNWQDSYSRFQLNNLSTDWVELQWRQDFSSDKELPPDYSFALEDEDYAVLLNELSESLREWSTYGDSSLNGTLNSSVNESITSSQADRRSWQTLLNSDVNQRALIAVISSFFKADHKELTDDVSRRLALSASRAYFVLLSIRGSQIFNVFNSVLFAQATESLKVLNLSENFEKPQQKKKRSRKKNDEPEPEEPPEIEDTDVVHISHTEKMEIVRRLIAVLDDLKFCLSSLSLKDDTDSLRLIISALVSIVRLEKTSDSFVQRCPKSVSVTFLSFKAYETLMSLCRPQQGAVSDVVRFICSSLMDHLTMKSQEIHISDRSKNVVRSHMIAFIKLMVNKLGEETYNGLTGLVQQLCVKTPDRADIRARCVQQIYVLMSTFPSELFAKITLWICSLVFNEQVKHRITAIEVLAKFLQGEEKSGVQTIPSSGDANPPSRANGRPESPGPSSENGEENQPQPGPSSRPSNLPNSPSRRNSTEIVVDHKLMLSAILSRMLDQSPTVRTKSLHWLGSLILMKHQVIQDIMQSLFVSPYVNNKTPISGVIDDERDVFDWRLFFLKKKIHKPNQNPLPGGTRIVTKLEALAMDEKIFVRKSALNVLCNVCRLNLIWATPQRIEIMIHNCLDLSVTVRKSMIQNMTDLLLEYPQSDPLVRAWVRGVMPLVADNEIKCQEKAVEAVSTVVLDNLVAHDRMATDNHGLPWRVIKLLPAYEMRKVFRFVCQHWVTTKRIGTKEMKILSSHIGTVNNLSAWYLIVCLSEFTDFCQPEMILDYYMNNIHNQPKVGEYCGQLVIEALLLNWRNLPRTEMDDLVQNKLLPSLENCILPVSFITPIMDICFQYDQAAFTDVGKRLITKCHNFLKKSIGPNSPTVLTSEDALTQHIFTLGDVTSLCPGLLPEECVQLLCNLIDDFLELVTGNQKWKGKVNSKCKAVTVTTLGKFCLQDEMLAKKMVPILGTLLDPATPSEVKLNTLTTMADLCVRFTSLVESYIGDMCVCLKDTDVRVRRTTLDLMIRLIQEDYIKLKCPYLYYVLHMLHDPEPRICTTMKAFIVNTILRKNPKIMIQEFSQALFFLNSFEASDGTGLACSKVSMNPNEKKAFSISGYGNRAKRRRLFTFMIENMIDDFKFKTLQMICQEVFDGVCEERIKLDNNGLELVSDAIFIIGCEDLRMKSMSNKPPEEEDDETPSEEKNEYVMGIVNVMLKHIFQTQVMPSIIKFKRKLQEFKSSLLRDLMVSLRSMMKDYKEWMQELLNSDPIMSSEIELDMRRLNVSEGVAEEEEAVPELPDPSNMNCSEPRDPTLPVPPLSPAVLQTNGSALKNPRQSTSICDVKIGEGTPSPVPSVVSDDDLSSLSAQSPSSDTSKSSKKGAGEKPQESLRNEPSPRRGRKRVCSATPSGSSSSPETPRQTSRGSPRQLETSDFSIHGSPQQQQTPSSPPPSSKSKKKPKNSSKNTRRQKK